MIGTWTQTICLLTCPSWILFSLKIHVISECLKQLPFCFEVHRFKAICILFTSHGYETFRYNILISSMLLVKVSKSNDLATFWLICVSKKVWYVFVVRNAYRMTCLLLNVLWRCNLYYVFLFLKRSIPNQILVRVRPVIKAN